MQAIFEINSIAPWQITEIFNIKETSFPHFAFFVKWGKHKGGGSGKIIKSPKLPDLSKSLNNLYTTFTIVGYHKG
jgi:hypothetical protein